MKKLGRPLFLSLLLLAHVCASSSAIAEQVLRIIAFSSNQSVGDSLSQKYEFKAEVSIGIAALKQRWDGDAGKPYRRIILDNTADR